MPTTPTILAFLSLPAGAVAYVITGQLVTSLLPNDGTRAFLVLVVPLFVAGLVMMPFLIPFFDRKARQDLAEHARIQASTAVPDDGSMPDQGPTVDAPALEGRDPDQPSPPPV